MYCLLLFLKVSICEYEIFHVIIELTFVDFSHNEREGERHKRRKALNYFMLLLSEVKPVRARVNLAALYSDPVLKKIFLISSF